MGKWASDTSKKFIILFFFIFLFVARIILVFCCVAVIFNMCSFISLYRNYCTIILNQLYICRAVVVHCVPLYVKFRVEWIMRYLYTLYRTSCTINLNFNDSSKMFQNVLRRRSNLKHYNSLYIGLIVLNSLNILFHCVYS